MHFKGLGFDPESIDGCPSPSACPLQVLRQILEMSVSTHTPIPQMQLHPLFTELHSQVSLAGSGWGLQGLGCVGCWEKKSQHLPLWCASHLQLGCWSCAVPSVVCAL